MERDFANDYEEWIRLTGGDTGSGGTIPTNTPPDANPNPYIPPAAPVAPSAPAGGGAPDLAAIEAAGRAYDAANGYIGGYMSGGQWVHGSPSSSAGGGYAGGGGDIGGGGDPSASWQWPSYTAPSYQSAGPFTPRRGTWDYTPFAYKEFNAPTIEQARNNPGYQFAAQEGINRLENSAAGRGTLRSGMTLKDIIGWGNKFADQNYDQVFNRELTTYGTNRNNAFDAYKTNLDTDFNKFSTEYGIDRDVYDRYASDTQSGNNYRLSASQAEFAPKFDASKLEFADAYAKWKAKLDAATQIATGGPA